MEFIVTDRASIERGIVVPSAYVVISIHDPDKPGPRIPNRVGLRDVIYVAFHDAEPVEGSVLPADVQPMTGEHAAMILEFVKRHREDVETIVCHCEQGMSRSPAVAAALCELLGEDAAQFFDQYQPNQYVYELVSQAGW